MRKLAFHHLVYYISKGFPDEILVSNPSFKSFTLQDDVDFVNYGPIKSEIDNKGNVDPS